MQYSLSSQSVSLMVTDRQTDRQTDRGREKDRDRETERERTRKRERERTRKRESMCVSEIETETGGLRGRARERGW